MTGSKSKLKCPECDVGLIHHADKPIRSFGEADGPEADPAVGGAIEEAHCCPECGKSEFRRVE